MQFTFTVPGILTTSISVAANAWSNKTASVTVNGLTTASNVLLGYAEATFDAAKAAVIRASAVSTNSLTLKCENTPSTAISLNLAIF